MAKRTRLMPGKATKESYGLPASGKAKPRFTENRGENRGTIINHDRQAELENAVLRAVTTKTRKNRRRVLIALRRLHAAPRPLSS